MPPLSPSDIRKAWIEALSPARFQTYVTAAAGDEERALRLYRWNTRIAAAWMPDLALIEVALRNAIHDTLANGTGHADWWNNLTLDNKTERNIDEAAKRIALQHRQPTPGHIVADLSLGNWVRLLGTGGRKHGTAVDYVKTIWRPHLAQRFPGAPNRQNMHSRVEQMRLLRNRIAHHEPLLHANLNAQHQAAIDLLKIISPVLAIDVGTTSLVPGMIRNRP